MSKYGYDDTRRTRFRRLLLGMGVAMLLFFLLLKIFFAEQLPFTSLHWKLIFGYFLLLSVSEDARSGSMVYSEWSDRDRGGSIAPLRGPWSRDPTVECRDKEPEDRYER